MMPRNVDGARRFLKNLQQARARGGVEKLTHVDGGERQVAENDRCAGVAGVLQRRFEPIELRVAVAQGARDVERDDENVAQNDGVSERKVAAFEEFAARETVSEGARIGVAFGRVLRVGRCVVIARRHDKIDAVVEENIADLVVKRFPHGVVRQTGLLPGDEIARADGDVRFAADDVGDGGTDCGRITDRAVARIDVGNDGNAYFVGRRGEVGRRGKAIGVGRGRFAGRWIGRRTAGRCVAGRLLARRSG